MHDVLQVLAVLTVVLATVPAVAHALELPGKMRLTRDAYVAMQPIYYPGFTIAGLGEPAAVILVGLLLARTPVGHAEFWLVLVALLGLVGMHAAYWLLTHPVNRFWVEGQGLGRAGAGFFSFASRRTAGREGEGRQDWTELRDRWEYSHVLRAGLATVSLVALVVAVSR